MFNSKLQLVLLRLSIYSVVKYPFPTYCRKQNLLVKEGLIFNNTLLVFNRAG